DLLRAADRAQHDRHHYGGREAQRRTSHEVLHIEGLTRQLRSRPPVHAPIETRANSVPKCQATTVIAVGCGAGRDRQAPTLLRAAPASAAKAPVARGASGAPRRSIIAMMKAGSAAPVIIATRHGQSE